MPLFNSLILSCTIMGINISVEVIDGGGTRTHTPVRADDFKSSASANSATPPNHNDLH